MCIRDSYISGVGRATNELVYALLQEDTEFNIALYASGINSFWIKDLDCLLYTSITPISKAILQTSINNFLDFHNTFMMEIKSILSSICLSVFIMSLIHILVKYSTMLSTKLHAPMLATPNTRDTMQF